MITVQQRRGFFSPALLFGAPGRAHSRTNPVIIKMATKYLHFFFSRHSGESQNPGHFWMPPAYYMPGQAYQVRHDELFSCRKIVKPHKSSSLSSPPPGSSPPPPPFRCASESFTVPSIWNGSQVTIHNHLGKLTWLFSDAGGACRSALHFS